LEFTKEELLKLMETIPNVQTFWSYVISEWVPKCEMWVMGNWNLPYIDHDTNVAIKSDIKSFKVIIIWKMGGLMHPPIIGICFVALLVSKFEKELGVCPK
jgi:hypothetical protein